MKKLFLVFIFSLFTSLIYCQNTNLKKTEIKGDLTETTLYYENGTVMQHGFYTAKSELHGSWESYN